MEEQLLAYCGLSCRMCPARLATLSDDIQEKSKVAAQWTEEFKTEIKAEDINCTGCKPDGVKFGHCHQCQIRQCSSEKKLENCGFCDDYPCDKLNDIFNHMPVAKDTLDSVNRAKNI